MLSKKAYATPLIVWVVNGTVVAPLRIDVSAEPSAPTIGNIDWRPFADVPAVTPNVRTCELHETEPNDASLRASSHASICRAETIGTCRACADATMASAPSLVALSVCMLAVNTP